MYRLKIKEIPQGIYKLMEIRKQLRSSGEYIMADKIRRQIESKGFLISDKENTSDILIKDKDKPLKSLITLFGSGELSPAGGQVHNATLKKTGLKSIKVAVITTPAGFQPNVNIVYQEVVDFFKVRLKNYHPEIKIIYANNRDDANNSEIVDPINYADYIFTGPGSPTYAVRHLRETKLLDLIIKKVQEGATLSLASAATIAFSRYALPVYEIYKVGENLHWVDGLNFYARFMHEVSFIPHFNNLEGGEKLDTSRCFMGKERFEKMLAMLPKNSKLIGIDELTGVIIDYKDNKKEVIGEGKIHDIRKVK